MYCPRLHMYCPRCTPILVLNPICCQLVQHRKSAPTYTARIIHAPCPSRTSMAGRPYLPIDETRDNLLVFAVLRALSREQQLLPVVVCQMNTAINFLVGGCLRVQLRVGLPLQYTNLQAANKFPVLTTLQMWSLGMSVASLGPQRWLPTAVSLTATRWCSPSEGILREV
jgi:hypothetical protein